MRELRRGEEISTRQRQPAEEISGRELRRLESNVVAALLLGRHLPWWLSLAPAGLTVAAVGRDFYAGRCDETH
ncbi:MAG TPA: hypothetical protein VMT64_04000 [Candidatus Binataceae bacterium]|nr:hypothetical protein [Candidatus Binataceae bacterium]